ncbi:RHS repeat-associated core domain-containing protein [Amycolatopsis sp. NPDC051071]|uniref:RHS repeat-associated core domain-containing protein n=1 Tax=Amycolatopsis sp. NPDC051071 TaxID=3154637 RepID=UPI00341DAD2A
MAGGGIVWFHRTTVWGRTQQWSLTEAYTPLRFAGQYADQESDLNYNYFRHYDQGSGRYMSADPLGLKADPNPHRYVHNSLGCRPVHVTVGSRPPRTCS